jgi:hypothetical protein
MRGLAWDGFFVARDVKWARSAGDFFVAGSEAEIFGFGFVSGVIYVL